MGVRLDVVGLLLGAEFRPDERGGNGFFSATVLPDGSRETLDVWAFGDNLAAHALLARFHEEGPGTRVGLAVEIRPKLSKAGTAMLSTGLRSVVTAAGEVVEGRASVAAAV